MKQLNAIPKGETDPVPQMWQQDLLIDGASCASCVKAIEQALAQVPGVERAEMNFVGWRVTVSGTAPTEQLVRAVERAGYQASSMDGSSECERLEDKEIADRAYYRRLMRYMGIALGLGVPLMIHGLFIGEMTVNTAAERIAWMVVGLLTLGVMVFSGRHFYVGAWTATVNHNANMDTLIALGTGTAWIYSMVVLLVPGIVPEMACHVYFEATAMIIGLINLRLALEVRARGRTSLAIKRLIGLQAKTARVVRDVQERDVPIEAVLRDDIVRVRPGEKVPVDGIVIEGRSAVDESMLTGEPMPISKALDDELAAGTLNKSGSMLFRASWVGADTALARIIEMVKRAQNSKPPIGRLADNVAAYFVPTVMIIACPCALGLTTPMSVMVGVGKAAEAGVLIRNGEALQTAAKLTAMVLDKTGTITQGAPRVTNVMLAGERSEDQVLQLAASIEAGSEHPLALAIIESAEAKGLPPLPVDSFEAIAGRGVAARWEQQRLLLGNEKLLRGTAVELGDHAAIGQRLATEAKTPMYLAIDGELAAVIAVADPIKLDSKAAIQRLQRDDLRVVMLTGDNRATAAAVAVQVGIEEYFAEVLPGEKAAKVEALQGEGEIVSMTGDGINDAPALALADVAIESADVTLMRGSLHGLADAIAISRATLSNIKQNLFGAFIYKVAGIPIAAGVLCPLSGMLLNPAIAGAAMAFSSLTVVSNASRLRFFKPAAH